MKNIDGRFDDIQDAIGNKMRMEAAEEMWDHVIIVRNDTGSNREWANIKRQEKCLKMGT